MTRHVGYMDVASGAFLTCDGNREVMSYLLTPLLDVARATESFLVIAAVVSSLGNHRQNV